MTVAITAKPNADRNQGRLLCLAASHAPMTGPTILVALLMLLIRERASP